MFKFIRLKKVAVLSYLVFFIFLFITYAYFLNITKIPLFSDETLYLSLADYCCVSGFNYLMPVEKSIMPVVPYLISPLMSIKEFNILWSARSMMVFTNLLSATVVFLIAKKLFPKYSQALLVSIIYLLLPVNFLNSRLVLLEPITNLFMLLLTYSALNFSKLLSQKARIIRKQVLINSFMFFLFLILSFLAKPISLIILPAILVIPLLNLSYPTDKSLYLKHIYIYFLTLLLIFISLVILPVLLVYLDNFSIYLLNPQTSSFLTQIKTNFYKALVWSKVYFNPFIILYCFFAGLYFLYKKKLTVIWLAFWVGSILIIEIVIGKNFFPRHLYYLSAPVSLLIAYLTYLLAKLSNKFFKIVLIIFLVVNLIFYSFVDYQIIVDPKNAPLALEDKFQLYQDWTSGLGLEAVGNYFDKNNIKGVLVVGDEPNLYWGLPNVYLLKNVDLYLDKQLSYSNSLKDLSLFKNKQPTYIILNYNKNIKFPIPAQKVLEIQRLNNTSSLEIYKITN